MAKPPGIGEEMERTRERHRVPRARRGGGNAEVLPEVPYSLFVPWPNETKKLTKDCKGTKLWIIKPPIMAQQILRTRMSGTSPELHFNMSSLFKKKKKKLHTENISDHIELYLLYLKPLKYIKHLIWIHLYIYVHLLVVPLPINTVFLNVFFIINPLFSSETHGLGWIRRGCGSDRAKLGPRGIFFPP